MITKKEIVRKFNLGLEKCLENKGEKGQIRTTKGQSVENLATDLITLAKKGMIIEKFICGYECKSYTENGCLNGRILFEIVLLKNRHESIRTILFQLERL